MSRVNGRIPRDVLVPPVDQPAIERGPRRASLVPAWAWVTWEEDVELLDGTEGPVTRRARAMPPSLPTAIENMAAELRDQASREGLPEPDQKELVERLLWIAENIPQGSTQRLVALLREDGTWGVTTEAVRG